MTCGSGSQQRNVQCINLESDNAATGCDIQTRPQSEQTCNTDKCNTFSAGKCKSTECISIHRDGQLSTHDLKRQLSIMLGLVLKTNQFFSVLSNKKIYQTLILEYLLRCSAILNKHVLYIPVPIL